MSIRYLDEELEYTEPVIQEKPIPECTDDEAVVLGYDGEYHVLTCATNNDIEYVSINDATNFDVHEPVLQPGQVVGYREVTIDCDVSLIKVGANVKCVCFNPSYKGGLKIGDPFKLTMSNLTGSDVPVAVVLIGKKTVTGIWLNIENIVTLASGSQETYTGITKEEEAPPQ